MHHRVLNVIDFVRITVMRETSEATSVEVDSQRLVGGHQHVDSHIKFLTSDQKRVHNISLHDVSLSLRTIGFPTEIVLPLSDLLKFVDQEDTSAL